MLKNNLIQHCTCGNSAHFTTDIINSIPVMTCSVCGVSHQWLKGWNAQKLNDFYEHEYHKKFQEAKGVVTYEDRYQNDCKVADMRLDAYKSLLPQSSSGLDIGSSNSAFVHRARALGYACLGLEPGEDIGDDSVTIRGLLGKVQINQLHWDWITMHDSIEHMVDARSALVEVYQLLKPNGLVIIDLPDFWKPAGSHHWKTIEHLWFFTVEQMTALLKENGFEVKAIKEPIPGKLVFYAVKL